MRKPILFILLIVQAFGQTQVKTATGIVEGFNNGPVRVFKGIPFAKPPVGDLRWKAPQALEPWTGVKICKTFSASPFQDPPKAFMFWSEEFLIPKSPISEDCLYLNVWTGAKKPREKRPVMVYIYGGGFRSGGAGCAIYDGTNMAKKGVVYVSINYRVGHFGFLAHPELTKEAGTSGNYALLDMIAALKWVQKNIAAFGGDPRNVTVAGQSAGSMAINYLVGSPMAKGLFQKAIAQSGGNVVENPARPTYTLTKAENAGLAWAEKLKAASLADLRAMAPADIQKSAGGVISPIVDGVVIPKTLKEIFEAGQQNAVTLLTGWNKDDRLSGPPRSAEAYKESIKRRFGTTADQVLALYPANDDATAVQSHIAYGRDEFFGIQNYTWAALMSKTSKTKAYVYNFDRQLPAKTPATAFGAFHSGEIVYAYNNLHTLDRPFEAADKALAERMSDYWMAFAKTGNPNGTGRPFWPVFKASDAKVLVLDQEIYQTELPSKKQMEFWQSYFN